jgi:hypothetical protein
MRSEFFQVHLSRCSRFAPSAHSSPENQLTLRAYYQLLAARRLKTSRAAISHEITGNHAPVPIAGGRGAMGMVLHGQVEQCRRCAQQELG